MLSRCSIRFCENEDDKMSQLEYIKYEIIKNSSYQAVEKGVDTTGCYRVQCQSYGLEIVCDNVARAQVMSTTTR